MLTSEERFTLKKSLERYEGRVSHMYLDSKGYVTVGVGHLLSKPDDAKKLPFKILGGRPASVYDIQRDYENVKRQPKNRLAVFYKKYTNLVLPDYAIDKLTFNHIENFYRELTIIYPTIDSFPSEARLALFDMIFNLGQTNLRGAWPNMNSAIRDRNWIKASKHSRRAFPVSDARNRHVRELFEKAWSKDNE